MFKYFGNGEVVPFISHQMDPTRKLFFSYDYTHLIKNMRNLFIDRVFDVCGEKVSFEPIKKVREIQKEFLFFRPMRHLTFKHTQPNSQDRMKVRFAKEIFSKEMIATLRLCQNNDLEGFRGIDATIELMEMNYLWFALHDVCNTTHHITALQPEKNHLLTWTTGDSIS
jgi:hypothetical protein